MIALTAVFSGVFVLAGVAVGQWLTYKREKWVADDQRDRNARFLAIRCVCVLDPFVSQCCDIAYDDGIEDQGGITQPRVATPELMFPTDVDWRSIPADLMYSLLTLPSEIAAADQVIAQVDEYIAGPPDYAEVFDERMIQYSKLGLKVLGLADQLRTKYQIPPWNHDGWDPRSTLDKKLAEVEKDKAKRAAHQAAFTQEIFKDIGDPQPEPAS
jgi:hypothetical protein